MTCYRIKDGSNAFTKEYFTYTGINISHVFFEKNNIYSRVEDYAFGNPDSNYTNHKLQSICLPESIRTIGNYAFKNAYNLTDMPLNNNIKSIGSNAFSGSSYNLHGLALTKLPDNLEVLGEYAFSDSSIKITELPNKITELPSYCFQRCANIRIDTFKEPLVSIGSYCFFGAGQNAGPIDRVYLYNTISRLGTKCFMQYGSTNGPSQIITTRSDTDTDVATWDAQIITNNPNATITTGWNGV